MSPERYSREERRILRVQRRGARSREERTGGVFRMGIQWLGGGKMPSECVVIIIRGRGKFLARRRRGDRVFGRRGGATPRGGSEGGDN